MSDDLPWFKCNPAEWLQSCADMESEEFGFYARLILFMYQRGGMAPYDEGKLRHIWNCSKQKARIVRDDLIKAGRIERVGDELTQSRVKRELRIAKKIGEKLRGSEQETDEKVDKNLPKTEQKVDKNLPKTHHVFSRNALKTNDPPLQIQEPDPEEEKEERKEGEKAPSAQAREAPFDSETCKPRPEDLKRLQETYPAQGLANSPPQALLVPIGKAAVRLGSMDALLAAMARYAEVVRRDKTLPVGLRRFLDPSEGFIDMYAEAAGAAEQQLDPAALDARYWRSYVGAYQRHSRWATQLGPRPGESGCKAPAEIQREYGYEPRPFRTDRGAA